MLPGLIALGEDVGRAAGKRGKSLAGEGKLLWQRDVVYKEPEITHPTNPFCSASPVTDGERVVASHGSAGLVCYDFEGKELWRYDVGKLEHLWGNASSPILHGDLCIQWCGPGARQFLLAVNKRTGEKVWETAEPGGDPGITASLKRMYEQEGAPKASRGAMSPELSEYVQRVMAARSQ